jgi:hypothetical protein
MILRGFRNLGMAYLFEGHCLTHCTLRIHIVYQTPLLGVIYTCFFLSLEISLLYTETLAIALPHSQNNLFEKFHCNWFSLFRSQIKYLSLSYAPILCKQKSPPCHILSYHFVYIFTLEITHLHLIYLFANYLFIHLK